eukprot:Gregarina_sp_Poly_1__5169@NODE_273_length_10223_cov_99_622391_g238_i0_p4_GENE_NODE_273_length_10223_cov_99_622391_g238_i0NODE_273_length_10223_cov_99_622391_g238_i0_p4_ORF_typecomplete_len337_score40_75UPF0160/PF03690_13/8_8e58_NODE_273_length_10223_cov_99_622391_g238_i011042114
MSIAIAPGGFSATTFVPAVLAAFIEGTESPSIKQTRDESELSACRWVINTGGEWDVSHGRLANPPVTERWNEDKKAGSEDSKVTIPLSAAGHLWKQFGQQILRSHFKYSDEDLIKVIHQKFYENVIQAIDASYFGINRCNCESHPSTSILSFGTRLSTLDPAWKCPNTSPSTETILEAFTFVAKTIEDIITNLANEFYPAYSVMTDAFRERSNRILKLARYVPWQSHLYDMEEALGLDEQNNILWVVFQDERNGQWRATSPASKFDRFKNRSLIDEKLRGLRDQELCETSGITDCNFVHHTGFTCGASTYEAIVQLTQFKDPAVQQGRDAGGSVPQ